MKAIEEVSPSGVMFADTPRLLGLELLADYKIEEGINLTIELMEINRWNKGHRISNGSRILLKYGPAAKLALPRLLETEKLFLEQNDGKPGRWSKEIRTLIEKIEAIDESLPIPELNRLPAY